MKRKGNMSNSGLTSIIVFLISALMITMVGFNNTSMGGLGVTTVSAQSSDPVPTPPGPNPEPIPPNPDPYPIPDLPDPSCPFPDDEPCPDSGNYYEIGWWEWIADVSALFFG